jgi:F-type H+-transporting ATPase subunit b
MPFLAAVSALLQEHAPAAQAAAEHAPSAGPFAINPGLTIWTLVVFGILMFILAKTAWPAILKQIEEREARIRQQIEDASKANAEAQRLLSEYQGQIAKARTEAQDLLAQGRLAGEKLREEMVAKGREEQEELLQRARREIALERDRAVTELRKEAVELSIAAATKVIEKNLDTEADRKLVQDYLASLRSTAS